MNDMTWFEQPKSAERIHPFWFWNGDMEDSEVIRQIEEMSAQGVGGFFICARQGMQVPYLSDEWFQKVRVALKAAEQHQMDVWLYDEYPYPSGIAGGEVTLMHPEAKHYTLEHMVLELQGGEQCTSELPWARLLSARAVPIDPRTKQRLWDQAIDIAKHIGNLQADNIFQKTGLTAYNQKRFFTYNTVKKIHWTAPEGLWEIHVFMEKELEDFKYYGTFVDPCNKEAIQTFIELTHERYAEEIGDYFGGTVKGMFTDETGFLGRMPWTPQLVNYFIEHNGYDLTEHLQHLLYDGGAETAKVRYDYFQALHLLLRENYHKPIREWCDKYGLEYVAEVPAMRMTTQLYSHVPGGDGAHEKLGRSLKWILDKYMMKLRNNPKMVTSLGRQLGADRALIECFHSVGWSMTLQDARWMIDRMAAMGVNFYNPHAFFYTLDGLTQHDAPPSQFLQNPYWKHFRLLGDYTGRISAVMSRGHADISIAIVDPTTTFWTHMGNPLHSFGYCGKDEAGEKRLARLKHHWGELCRALLMQRKDYDHLDPELLARAEVKNGTISIGHATYTTLILPPMSNLETEAWEKIKVFLQQGGHVIANGLLPYEHIDHGKNDEEWLAAFGLSAPVHEDYWKQEEPSKHTDSWVKGERNAYFLSGRSTFGFAEDVHPLITLLDELEPQAVRLEVEDGANAFLMQQRRMTDESAAVFISNQEDGRHQTYLQVSSKLLMDTTSDEEAALCFARLDLETGKKQYLSADRTEQGWILPLVFEKYESHLIEITLAAVTAAGEPNANEATPSSSEGAWQWSIPAQVPWAIKAEQSNVVRLDQFDLIAGGAASGKNVQVKTFIDQCADLDASPPVRYDQIFGTPSMMSPDYPIDCQYTTRILVEEKPASCYLLMDRGAISGEFVISINGHPIVAEDFESQHVYDHMNRVCEITSMLQQGENKITVQVRVEQDWDGVVDALYMMGPFGVHHNEQAIAVLTLPAEQSLLHRGPYSSYPYYAGTISFTRDVYLDQVPNAASFELIFEDWDADFYECAEVSVNGKSLGVRAWTPYCWQGMSDMLIAGHNVVEVKVTNTLIGMLEGKYFDYSSHSLKDASSLDRV